MILYDFQCCSCGGSHTLSAAEVEAVPGGAPALANRGRECPDCALHGGPRFPLWRWRRRELPPLTAAGKLALRGLMVKLRAHGGSYGG
jgi:hypothetical protein